MYLLAHVNLKEIPRTLSPRKFIVRERSMVPTFIPGDHVLTFNWGKFKAGDAIVFAQGDKNYIKRISKVAGDLYYVGGDNPVDSAQLGPIEKVKILGKVILKY